MTAMPFSYKHSHQVDSTADRDGEDAIAGTVHDPLWFLAHQWQMGEFQGENASTPVKVTLSVGSETIERPGAHVDVTPAEPLIESEQDDWWTMGRRIRIGNVLSDHAASADLRFGSLAPPYDAFSREPDGLALWHARNDLGLERDPAFASVPPESPSTWNPVDLWYEQDAAFTAGADTTLNVVRHGGGPVDWYTVDAAQPRTRAAVDTVQKTVLPSRITYPGMPRRGLWEIEDAEDDLGALTPDSAHTATALMTDLFFSHHDEWFIVPVGGSAGSIVSVSKVEVTDSFGIAYASDAGSAGLRPPMSDETTPWTLYQTAGLDPDELVLWHVAELPLESDAIERVQLGIDEAMNMVWAVERRIDGRDCSPDGPEPPPETVSLIPEPPSQRDVPPAYTYVPQEGAAPHWIPYELDVNGDGARSFIQRQVADLSLEPPLPMGKATASVLTVVGGVHRITAASIPSGGTEFERRWQLARDMKGRPVLWIQRQRKALVAPPARLLAFDVAEPMDAGEAP